jgi:DNA-directed RNA polymerase subunit RPC12/RpoP
MPIRFRCAYCNQLMGIARRKAGTVVRCPTCSGQVVVPHPNPSAEAAAPDPAPQEERRLFEQSDFGDVFQNPVKAPRAVSRGAAPAANYGVEPVALNDQPAPLHGVFLSPGKVTLLSVVVVLLLGVAFFAGLLMGRAP